MNTKPMLAGKFVEDKAEFPMYAQPKLDGIRILATLGQPITRTLKVLPNRHIQEFFREYATALNGLDGEIIVGPVTHKNVYRTTASGCMSEAGTPDFVYHVFDSWLHADLPFVDRHHIVKSWWNELQKMDVMSAVTPKMNLVKTVLISDMESLQIFEEDHVVIGYEGIIIRGLTQKYKSGRSTTREGALLKLKRFLDAEAVIVGFEELMHNANPAELDNLGHTKHSSHKAGKVPMDTLGSLQVKNLSDGLVFHIGTGFDFALRKKIWNNRKEYLAQTVKYKYVKVGGYDLPRFPVFLGFRDPMDT